MPNKVRGPALVRALDLRTLANANRSRALVEQDAAIKAELLATAAEWERLALAAEEEASQERAAKE